MAIQQAGQNNSSRRQQGRQAGEGGRGYGRRESEWWQRKGLADANAESLARALGWFSIGLGLIQLAAPRRFAHWIGVGDGREAQTLLRVVGLREIVSGIGILTRPRPIGWLQARVGGDVMDLALLGAALTSDEAEQDRVAITMAMVAGITIVDLLCSQQLRGEQFGGQEQELSDWPIRQSAGEAAAAAAPARGIYVKKSITINRPPEDLYQFWHNFQNLPRLMRHLESVQVLDEKRSHWRAKAPAGMTVEWDAEIIEDRPNEEIAWRSLEGATVPNAGSVRFERAAGDRGTVVSVALQYDPPGGGIGATIAKLFGEEPEQQVQDDLRLFKQVMETGEVVRSEGTFRGADLRQRPAQPSSEDETMHR